MTPALGAGISASTLSVVTSTIGWSTSTISPSETSQRDTVPSNTLSPSEGNSTVIDILIPLEVFFGLVDERVRPLDRLLPDRPSPVSA